MFLVQAFQTWFSAVGNTCMLVTCPLSHLPFHRKFPEIPLEMNLPLAVFTTQEQGIVVGRRGEGGWGSRAVSDLRCSPECLKLSDSFDGSCLIVQAEEFSCLLL